MFLLKLLLFFVVLSLIVLVHEFGHFICAKMFNVFIYEFSIGMGPIVFSHKGKDGIDYNFRALPIGGYVSMAGEVYEDDSNEKIPKDRFMCNRPWWQRLIILCAGVFNNFVLALVLLFTIACIWGGATYKPIIAEVQKDSAAEQVGLVAGDRILKINGKKVSSWEVGQILLIMKDKDGVYDFSVKHKDGKIEEYHIKPNMVMDKETKKESPVFGIAIKQSVSKTLWGHIKYAFTKFSTLVVTLWYTLGGLFTGKIALSNLSGPVGIYQVIGSTFSYKAGAAFNFVLYITAYLSLNVGIMNILPFPAFDGGRVFFILVEKIKGSPVNSKFENVCHTIGFVLLMLLMIFVTFNDIWGVIK